MKRKSRFYAALILVAIFSALFFTAPQYVKCKELCPDQLLDLFGIANNPPDSESPVSPGSILPVMLNSILTVGSIELSEWLLQPFPSELVLTVTLRR